MKTNQNFLHLQINKESKIKEQENKFPKHQLDRINLDKLNDKIREIMKFNIKNKKLKAIKNDINNITFGEDINNEYELIRIYQKLIVLHIELFNKNLSKNKQHNKDNESIPLKIKKQEKLNSFNSINEIFEDVDIFSDKDFFGNNNEQ